MRIREKAKPSISREISEACCVSRFSNAFPFLRSQTLCSPCLRCVAVHASTRTQAQMVGNGVTERKARSRDGRGRERERECTPRCIPRDREKGTPRPRGVTRATTRSPFPIRNAHDDGGGYPALHDAILDDTVSGAVSVAQTAARCEPRSRACIIRESRWKIVRGQPSPPHPDPRFSSVDARAEAWKGERCTVSRFVFDARPYDASSWRAAAVPLTDPLIPDGPDGVGPRGERTILAVRRRDDRRRNEGS